MKTYEAANLIKHFLRCDNVLKTDKPFDELKGEYPAGVQGGGVDLELQERISPKYLQWRWQNGDSILEHLLHVYRKFSMDEGMQYLLRYPHNVSYELSLEEKLEWADKLEHAAAEFRRIAQVEKDSPI